MGRGGDEVAWPKGVPPSPLCAGYGGHVTALLRAKMNRRNDLQHLAEDYEEDKEDEEGAYLMNL